MGSIFNLENNMKIGLENQHIAWANNLRFFATVSVIFLHVTAGILNQYKSVSSFVWWTGNIYDSLVRFCVPAFLMLTGALMLNKNYELNYFLKKKFLRIVLPFIFWSMVYISFALNNKLLQRPEMSFFEIIKWCFNLFKSGSSVHLWYIYMIIGIYLFIPIINKWIQNASEKEVLYFLFIWILTIIFDLPFFSKFRINIDLTYFAGFLGYLILGYYLSVKKFKYSTAKIRFIAMLLIFVGVSTTIFGTYFLTKRDGIFNDCFYNYLSIGVLISSVGFFIFIKYLNIFKLFFLRIINFISKFSYGIYLVHILVLNFLDTLCINYKFIEPVFAIPLTTLVCLFISSMIVYLVNSFPFGKYISG